MRKTDVICELHFRKEEVSKEFVHNLPNNEICTFPREKPLLKKGSIPSIFSEIQEKQKEPQAIEFYKKRDAQSNIEVMDSKLIMQIFIIHIHTHTHTRARARAHALIYRCIQFPNFSDCIYKSIYIEENAAPKTPNINNVNLANDSNTDTIFTNDEQSNFENPASNNIETVNSDLNQNLFVKICDTIIGNWHLYNCQKIGYPSLFPLA